MDSRLVLISGVPLKYPGAKISLFCGPKGSQSAGTSLLIMIDVRARPPRPVYSSGTFLVMTDPAVMFILINFMLHPFQCYKPQTRF
jgi:hypothetical protein